MPTQYSMQKPDYAMNETFQVTQFQLKLQGNTNLHGAILTFKSNDFFISLVAKRSYQVSCVAMRSYQVSFVAMRSYQVSFVAMSSCEFSMIRSNDYQSMTKNKPTAMQCCIQPMSKNKPQYCVQSITKNNPQNCVQPITKSKLQCVSNNN
jgi:hypothetical protein